MSLAIIQSVSALAPSLSIPFGATGGTAPYAWSVLPGGAGGSIDTSTGQYTSPSGTGTDIIQVMDAALATATYDINIGTPLELVCDIIQSQMGLSQGQVYLYNQKINIPTDSRLYVAVGVLSCKPFGNRPRYTSGSGLTAVQSINMSAQLSIDILSRGPAARDQKEQVLLALSSPYAQSQMELNSFYIAPISSAFVNISEVEAAAIPYRFNISVGLQYFSTLNTATPYFDTFSPPVLTTEP